MKALGIDIGGTSVKGAVVDTKKGRLLTDRIKVPTPDPATPAAVVDTVASIVRHFEWTGPIGCTFPGVVRDGFVQTAANVDSSWLGIDAATVISSATGCAVTIVNDADAAGEAEICFGAARGQGGVIMMITLGTGIGSALMIDGTLVPNTELGHIPFRGGDAEAWSAASVRERLELDWDEWAARVDDYLCLVERLFWPDLFIIGGGVSRKADKFIPRLTCRTPTVAATLLNQAGIIGAAMAVRRNRNLHGTDGQSVRSRKR
jgi:polyphosphate glucokinase